jgi:hypothetical protein
MDQDCFHPDWLKEQQFNLLMDEQMFEFSTSSLGDDVAALLEAEAEDHALAQQTDSINGPDTQMIRPETAWAPLPGDESGLTELAGDMEALAGDEEENYLEAGMVKPYDVLPGIPFPAYEIYNTALETRKMNLVPVAAQTKTKRVPSATITSADTADPTLSLTYAGTPAGEEQAEQLKRGVLPPVMAAMVELFPPMPEGVSLREQDLLPAQVRVNTLEKPVPIKRSFAPLETLPQQELPLRPTFLGYRGEMNSFTGTLNFDKKRKVILTPREEKGPMVTYTVQEMLAPLKHKRSSRELPLPNLPNETGTDMLVPSFAGNRVQGTTNTSLTALKTQVVKQVMQTSPCSDDLGITKILEPEQNEYPNLTAAEVGNRIRLAEDGKPHGAEALLAPNMTIPKRHPTALLPKTALKALAPAKRAKMSKVPKKSAISQYEPDWLGPYGVCREKWTTMKIVVWSRVHRLLTVTYLNRLPLYRVTDRLKIRAMCDQLAKGLSELIDEQKAFTMAMAKYHRNNKIDLPPSEEKSAVLAYRFNEYEIALKREAETDRGMFRRFERQVASIRLEFGLARIPQHVEMYSDY